MSGNAESLVTNDGVVLEMGIDVWRLEADGTITKFRCLRLDDDQFIAEDSWRNRWSLSLSDIYGDFATAVAEMSDRLEAEEVRCRLARRALSNKLRAHESERNEE